MLRYDVMALYGDSLAFRTDTKTSRDHGKTRFTKKPFVFAASEALVFIKATETIKVMKVLGR